MGVFDFTRVKLVYAVSAQTHHFKHSTFVIESLTKSIYLYCKANVQVIVHTTSAINTVPVLFLVKLSSKLRLKVEELYWCNIVNKLSF